MPADTFVVHQPVSVTEFDPLGDRVHSLYVRSQALHPEFSDAVDDERCAMSPRSAVLCSAGLDSAVLAAAEAQASDVYPVYVSAGLAWEAEELAALDRLL